MAYLHLLGPLALPLVLAGPGPGAPLPDAAGSRLDHAPFARIGGWSGRTPFDIEFHEMAPIEGTGGRAYEPFLEAAGVHSTSLVMQPSAQKRRRWGIR